MATRTRAVTADSLGAWLIKANGNVSAVADLIRHEFSTVARWCLRQTYRADLVASDQPVLFWVSGSSEAHPAGIYAEGRTTGRASADLADGGWMDPEARGQVKLSMPVRLRALAEPVLRSDLLDHPALSSIEVLKMAAGSNPSFVTPGDLAALRADWPQVTVR